MADGSTSEVLSSAEPLGQGFLERLRAAFDVVRFRTATIDAVLRDDGAAAAAVAIVALAGVAGAAASGRFVLGYLTWALGYLLLSLLLAGVVHLGASVVLRGSGDFVSYYRAFGHTYVLLWLAGIPVIHEFLIWALWAWQLAAIVYVTERAYRLERVQAVAVVGIPLLAAALVGVLVSGLMGLVALVNGWLF